MHGSLNVKHTFTVMYVLSFSLSVCSEQSGIAAGVWLPSQYHYTSSPYSFIHLLQTPRNLSS